MSIALSSTIADESIAIDRTNIALCGTRVLGGDKDTERSENCEE
jgi:hypothetical protein